MKNFKLITLLLTLVVVVGSVSCKYENGPTLSLRSKKARVAGSWFLYEIITKDEQGKIETETIVFKEDENVTHLYTKDGDYTNTDIYGGNTYISNAKWEFSDGKSKIKHNYEDGTSESAEILKLEHKEMWLKLSENNVDYEFHYRAI